MALATSYNRYLAEKINHPPDTPPGDVLRDLVLRGAVDESEAALLQRLQNELQQMKEAFTSRCAIQKENLDTIQFADAYLRLRSMCDALQKQVSRSAFDRAFMDRIDQVIPFFPIREPNLLKSILQIKLRQAGWTECPQELQEKIVSEAKHERESVRALERLVNQYQISYRSESESESESIVQNA